MNVECQIFPFLCFLSVNLRLIVLRTNWSLSDNSKVKMKWMIINKKVLNYFLCPMMINVALVNLPQVNPGRTVKIGLELIIMVAFYLIWKHEFHHLLSAFWHIHDHLCKMKWSFWSEKFCLKYLVYLNLLRGDFISNYMF